MKKFALIAALLLAGCSHNSYGQMAKFHDDGRAKPVLVFTPVYDRHDIELPWKLCDELTYAIQTRLAKHGGMFIVPDTEMLSIERHIQEGKNPFVGDYGWVKEAYKEGEFVAFLELVRHDIHPRETSKSLFDAITPSYVLDMVMRVRIFDVRGDEPELVLQELVSQSHMLPKQLANMDFHKAKWGKKTYGISPMGLAHSSMCKEVAGRVEEYTLLAKSRSHGR